MLKKMVLGALLAACVAPAFAQGLKVGDEVRDFTPRNWINPPAFESFKELQGDVVVIKAWGKN
ncbi:MAG: hypothetical protein H6841_05480 [Planctomycetes bacterium]|nr:hypothetical protein [Planctomycetota bacterium]MCB9935065.1 hypothetical protein [Planctomycetota bacterium]